MNTRTWPYGTTRRAYVLSCWQSTLVVNDDAEEKHLLIGTGHDPNLTEGTVGTLEFRQGGPTGGYWHFTPDKPILFLDPNLKRTINAAVHEDGSPWPERDDELCGLYLELQFGDRADDMAAYKALKDSTQFAERPLFMKHQYLYGAAHKAAKFQHKFVFATHPDNIADWTDEQRQAFDIRHPSSPGGQTLPLIDHALQTPDNTPS